MDDLVIQERYDDAADIAIDVLQALRDNDLVSRCGMVGSSFARMADLLDYRLNDQPAATEVLKGMTVLPDANHRPTEDSHTYGEWASFRLGQIYQDAGCDHSAIHWLQHALTATRACRLTDATRERLRTVLNRLASSYMRLDLIVDGLACYRELLAMTPWESQRPEHLSVLVQPALVELIYGDQLLGRRLLRAFHDHYPCSTLERLGFHVQVFLAEGRAHVKHSCYADAIDCATDGIALLDRHCDLEPSFELRGLMLGLWARALIAQGQLAEAATKILEVHREHPDKDRNISSTSPLENVELLRDLARIDVHSGRFDSALTCYLVLARHYGHRMADYHKTRTSQQRLEWVFKQTGVVHEMVSAWLSMPCDKPRNDWQVHVANALLQLKANLFLSTTFHRACAYRRFEGLDLALFAANRRYALAARRLWNGYTTEDAWLEVEHAFMRRESVESRMSGGAGDIIPQVSKMFSFDFRELTGSDNALIDYSVIDYGVPLPGEDSYSGQKLVIGIKGMAGELHIVNLGELDRIEGAVGSFLDKTTEPSRSYIANEDVLKAAELLYSLLLGPFGPLPPDLLLSPDGILARVPFCALVHKGRYLIEDHTINLRHSVLQAATQRLSPFSGVYYATEENLLVGDPDYRGSAWARLPGTKAEINALAKLFRQYRGESKPEGSTHTRLGRHACVQALEEISHPAILHIAAHGIVMPCKDVLESSASAVEYWPYSELVVRPLAGLDACLLRSMVVLSRDPAVRDDDGRLVSALELSSLNLLGCSVLSLSACNTGRGVESSAAGVLGLQFAVRASMATWGLLSLWEIGDDDTVSLMTQFYDGWLRGRDLTASYHAALRRACRKQGHLAHPFDWAAFVLLG